MRAQGTAWAALGASVLSMLGCASASPVFVLAESTATSPGVRLHRVVSAPSEAPLGRVRSLHRQCRARLVHSVDTSASLDQVRAAIAPGCVFRSLEQGTGRLRLTCQDRAVFSPGIDRISVGFDREIPASAVCPRARAMAEPSRFACVGEILGSIRTLAALRVAVLGGVDLERLARAQQGCADVGQGIEALAPLAQHPAARGVFRPGDPDERGANDRLAYCRAARVASLLYAGILQAQVPSRAAPELSVFAMGVSHALADDAQCTLVRCAARRRVEVLLDLQLQREERAHECTVQDDDPARALHCLQTCDDEVGAVLQPTVATEDRSMDVGLDPRILSCWHLAESSRATRVPWLSPWALLGALGTPASYRCSTSEITGPLTP
ncbi:MAG: hypothetical protein Q8Q09_20235 [Deltaproteobacteria bacterium]|nr:hypothetical protein [Deltaproteobacteria bacterium]